MQQVGDRGGIPVLDDFAHHPTEVAATLQATRALLPDTKRLVVVLEAQRHKRLVRLAKGYGTALRAADLVLLMSVDGACQTQSNDGQALLAEALTDQGVAFRSIAGPDQLIQVPWRAGDTAVIMAHGTSNALAKAVLAALPEQPLTADAVSVVFGPPPLADAPQHLLDHFARRLAAAPDALAAARG